jgi:sugar/nucleoside kinase (ribokinase family)
VPPLWDVIGIGATSVDYVYRVPAYPGAQGPDSKVRISSHTISCGGQTATALATCASLGLRTSFLGAIGRDENGRRIREAMQRSGIDLSHAVERDAANQFAVILVHERSGERSVVWSRDDELGLKPGELDSALLTSARVLHVDDVDQEAAISAATLARASGVVVTSDIDRITPRTDALVAAVGIPILAEHVPAALTGEPDVERAVRLLQQRRPGMLCVTLGAQGALLADRDRIYRDSGFSIGAVDTTGAGDVFRGAFIYGLLRGDPPAHILRFANAAAAVSVTRRGAIDSVPTLADIEILLK